MREVAKGVKTEMRARGQFKLPPPVQLRSHIRLRRPLWPADPQASEDRFVINLTQTGGEHEELTFYRMRGLKQRATVWQRSANGCFWVLLRCC